MNLKELLQAFDYKIAGGSEYNWKCFGNRARYIDFESEFSTGSVIFDCDNQTVYQAEIWPNDQGESHYRWTNPDFIDACKKEHKKKDIKWHHAFDETEFVDLEVEEDFLEKANAIFNGLEFDKRVQVPLDLDDDLLFELFKQAHARDITLNEMVEEILWHVIEQDRKSKAMSRT